VVTSCLKVKRWEKRWKELDNLLGRPLDNANYICLWNIYDYEYVCACVRTPPPTHLITFM